MPVNVDGGPAQIRSGVLQNTSQKRYRFSQRQVNLKKKKKLKNLRFLSNLAAGRSLENHSLKQSRNGNKR